MPTRTDRFAVLDEGNTEPLAAPLVREFQVVPDRSVSVGTTLRSRYVLEEIIGQGGDSIVFRAQDLHRSSSDDTAERYVAIKVLLPHKRFDPNALTRLKREFRQMQRLTHPGVVRVFDLDCDADIWFMSMELVIGQTVNTWLPSSGFEHRLKLIGEVGEALNHAHSKAIVHGDLKLSNVLVTPEGSVKLIDFGSARTEPRIDEGQESAAAATLSYASPQVLEGEVAEIRDDVFSLASLSYVILSEGRRPFEDMSSLAAYRTGFRLVAAAGIPERLSEVILRGLAAEREQRPATVAEFLHELGRASRTPVADPVTEDLHLPREVPRAAPAKAIVVVPAPVVELLPQQSSTPRGFVRRYAALVGLTVIVMGTGVLAWQAMNQSNAPAMLPPPIVPAPIDSPAVDPRGRPCRWSTTSNRSPMPPQELPSAVAGRLYTGGTITFDSHAMMVAEAQSLVAIPIKRMNATRGTASVAWSIESGSAQPNVDYQPVNQNVVRFIEGQVARSIFIPLVERNAKATAHGPRTFVVSLQRLAGGPELGPVSRITVTIWPRPGSTLDQRNAQLSAGGM